MDTLIFGKVIPSYPLEAQETCHQLIGNIIHQINTQEDDNRYLLLSDGENSMEFVLSKLADYNYQQRKEGNIETGDIILLYENGMLLHSMIAITANLWFGVNNTGTFARTFELIGIPVDTLLNRREIDLNLVSNFVPASRQITLADGKQFELAVYSNR